MTTCACRLRAARWAACCAHAAPVWAALQAAGTRLLGGMLPCPPTVWELGAVLCLA